MPGFFLWIKYWDEAPSVSASGAVTEICKWAAKSALTNKADLLAYDAPFPPGDERFLAGARMFPSLVLMFPDGGLVRGSRCARTHLWGARWAEGKV